MIMNAVFAVLMKSVVQRSREPDGEAKGNFGFLSGFAVFVATMTLFKFIFAAAYLFKWFLRSFDKAYQASGKDLNKIFHRMKRDPEAAYSTDEDTD